MFVCSPKQDNAGSGPKKIKDSPTLQPLLKILVTHWLRTRKIGDCSSSQACSYDSCFPFFLTSFSLTCTTSFAELAFSKSLSTQHLRTKKIKASPTSQASTQNPIIPRHILLLLKVDSSMPLGQVFTRLTFILYCQPILSAN